MKIGLTFFALAGLNLIVFGVSIFMENNAFLSRFISFDSITIHSFYFLPLFIICILIGGVISVIESSADILTNKETLPTKAEATPEKKPSTKENVVFILILILVGVIIAGLISLFLFN